MNLTKGRLERASAAVAFGWLHDQQHCVWSGKTVWKLSTASRQACRQYIGWDLTDAQWRTVRAVAVIIAKGALCGIPQYAAVREAFRELAATVIIP